MRNWLAGLEPRELNALIAGVLALSVLIVYQFVWTPAANGLRQGRAQAAQLRTDADWMRAAAARLKSAGSGPARAVKGGDQSLLSVVDQTTRQFTLDKVIKRIEPDGKTGVRVWIEQAEFGQVARWLAGLQTQYGVVVETTNLEARDEPGLVNARIVLTRGA